MRSACAAACGQVRPIHRSEEHTSELQSRGHLVCRLLLEKKKTRLLSNSASTFPVSPSSTIRHPPSPHILFCPFLLPSSPHHRTLHSFPTRRSSDLYHSWLVTTFPSMVQAA